MLGLGGEVPGGDRELTTVFLIFLVLLRCHFDLVFVPLHRVGDLHPGECSHLVVLLPFLLAQLEHENFGFGSGGFHLNIYH